MDPRLVMETFFTKFGAPKKILTDNGREFVNQINYQIYEWFGREDEWDYLKDLDKVVVHIIWTGEKEDILWSKIGPYKFFSRNLREHVGPGTLVESEIINAYLTTTVDPMDYDVMVGAVCDENHWTLTAIYPQEKRSLYVDPFGAQSQALKRCTEVSRAFMRQRGLNVSRWSCESITHPLQQDATACGVMCLADMILKQKLVAGPFDEQEISHLRMDIAQQLITETDDLSELCRFVANMTPMTNGRSARFVKADYYCPACI
ncbi:hypothetical protein PBY51_020493 [Eleginops maclovinus]|uniref:Uncharacterized protein n=1 Tax=Eleginops maclovinus TaxID=56733 RepID=A0AAN8AKR1_ELEMC|nr:hypothetical protein PBY51_020493 [Eleginops maclovinus]